MEKPSSKTPSSSYPPLPWKGKLIMSALSALTDASRRSDGTVNRRLLSVFDIRAPSSRKPREGVRTADVAIDPSRDLWLRLFLPSPAPHRHLPVIVFFHGGGFAFCSPASWAYDAFCRRLSREIPAVVASINYRLAPENRFPAPYEDGIDALKFIDSGGLDEDTDGAADLANCFLIGDSAGGNIVHHVARRWAAMQSMTRVRVAGMVAIQPFFGGEERTESEVRPTRVPLVSADRADWYWRAFLPEGSDRDHEAANVFGPRVTGDLEEGFPPAVVVVGGYDPLQDWQRRYCEGLREKGREARLVDFPDAIHSFYLIAELPETLKLIQETRDFIEAHRLKHKEGK